MPPRAVMDRDEVWRRRDEFRALARVNAATARKLLTGDEDRAVYHAALELRMSLEALIYAHAIDYLDELGDPKRLDWQAPKLLETLLEIDPFADSSIILADFDEATGERREIAVEERLNLKKLKARYYKLGAALHSPTIADLANGKTKDMIRFRSFCDEVLSVVDQVLASTATVTGGTHHPFFVMKCSCGAVIKRRSDPLWVNRCDPNKGASILKVPCTNCQASVEVTLNDAADTFDIRIMMMAYDCPHHGCGGKNNIWERELVDGKKADCSHCGKPILMSKDIRPVAVS